MDSLRISTCDLRRRRLKLSRTAGGCKADRLIMDVQAVTRFAQQVFVPTLTAHTLLAVSLAYIPSGNTHIRSAISAVIAAICMETIRRCGRDTYEESSYADYMFGMAFHTNCYLVLLNLSPPSTLKTAWEKLHWGIDALFSPRMGTKPYRRDPPGRTRRGFLLRRFTVLVCIVSLWLYIRDGDRFYPKDLEPEDWRPSKTYMMPQIINGTLTFRDIWFRAVMCFYAYSGSALCICGGHTICALIAVGILNSPLQSWPPLFGDIREAYTLRRWYSHFWHKAMRKAFTIHAVVVTEKCLGLRKHTVAGRSIIVLLSFLFSGIMHSITGWQTRPCSDNFAPVRIYELFGIFILLEQAVLSAYFMVHERTGIPWTKAEMVFWRLVGYVWVAFFLMEITVSSSYSSLRCVLALDGT